MSLIFPNNHCVKKSKYGVFSGPYTEKYGPEKTLYLDTFHIVHVFKRIIIRVVFWNGYKENLLDLFWMLEMKTVFRLNLSVECSNDIHGVKVLPKY